MWETHFKFLITILKSRSVIYPPLDLSELNDLVINSVMYLKLAEFVNLHPGANYRSMGMHAGSEWENIIQSSCTIEASCSYAKSYI